MSEPVDVMALADLEEGTAHRVEVAGRPVCLVRLGDEVHGVHDVCTHALESLSAGRVDGERIECPRHGALFSMRSGAVLSPPASRDLPTFPVSVRDGRVLVDPTPSHPHPLVD
ncbi:MAG: non-heme iron oxygenase ferredoxin subunit [Miltoncostaeaceae bacterium]